MIYFYIDDDLSIYILECILDKKKNTHTNDHIQKYSNELINVCGGGGGGLQGLRSSTRVFFPAAADYYYYMHFKPSY